MVVLSSVLFSGIWTRPRLLPLNDRGGDALEDVGRNSSRVEARKKGGVSVRRHE